ncbi:MAG: glycosyltransferase family 2 protein [Flavobacteriaceae bacterium]
MNTLQKPIDISVIAPIYNEEGNIEEFTNRVLKVLNQMALTYELIFINDGSKDQSLLKIFKICEAHENVFFINLSRNFGHQIAVSAGLDHVSGQCTVIIDSDLQDPPELIPTLYKKYKEGNMVVYARRNKRKGESFFKLLSAKLFYRIIRKLTTIDIPLDTGDFRLIDQSVVKYLRLMPEKNKFLRGQIAWLGLQQTAVFYNRDERKVGVTGYPFKKMMRFALDGITGFSEVPLSFVTRLGFIILFISFLVILYAFYSHYFLKVTITGWTSLMVGIMFMGGIQLFCLGIIGEYLSRMNKNSMNRPLYIIEKTNLVSPKENA